METKGSVARFEMIPAVCRAHRLFIRGGHGHRDVVHCFVDCLKFSDLAVAILFLRPLTTFRLQKSVEMPTVAEVTCKSVVDSKLTIY